jgi:hypothetical protein
MLSLESVTQLGIRSHQVPLTGRQDKFRPQVKWWSDLGSVLTFKNIPAIKTVLIKYIQTRSLDVSPPRLNLTANAYRDRKQT